MCGIVLCYTGVLALPVAEFLAVKHGTSYLGYSQHSSKGAAHPFFASRLKSGMPRPAGADAADAEAAAVAAAAGGSAAAAAAGEELEQSGSGLARTGSGAVAGAHKKHSHGRDLSTSEDVPLITCTGSATLLQVRLVGTHTSGRCSSLSSVTTCPGLRTLSVQISQKQHTTPSSRKG